MNDADNNRDLFLHDPTWENKIQILNWFLVFNLGTVHSLPIFSGNVERAKE